MGISMGIPTWESLSLTCCGFCFKDDFALQRKASEGARFVSMCRFFFLMFQKCRNGKVPTVALECALLDSHSRKAIWTSNKDLQKSWEGDAGAFHFFIYISDLRYRL